MEHGIFQKTNFQTDKHGMLFLAQFAFTFASFASLLSSSLLPSLFVFTSLLPPGQCSQRQALHTNVHLSASKPEACANMSIHQNNYISRQRCDVLLLVFF